MQLAEGMATRYWKQEQGVSYAVDFGELCDGLLFVCNQSTSLSDFKTKRLCC